MTTARETPPGGWRTFLIVWTTQAISVFGSSVVYFAITIWLTTSLYPGPEQRSELALALAAVSLAAMLPRLIAAPVAGSWADRHDRRLTMLSADFISAGLSFLTMFLMINGLLTLVALLILTAAYATTAAFHYAAFDTSYATLVPDEKLPRANGMMQTTYALADVVAPAVAAALIALPALARQGQAPAVLGWLGQGAALAFGVDAVTFLIGAIALVMVRIPMPKQSARPAGSAAHVVWNDVRIGVSFILQRRPMLWLLGTFTFANLMFAPLSVLVPLVIKFNQQADWMARGMSYEAALALLSTALGLGGIAGGLVISVWGGLRRQRVLGVVVPMIAAGLLQAIFGLTPRYDIVVAAGFLFGFLGPGMNAHSQAIWQSQVPPELQGRVFAVRRLIAQCTAPLGTMIAGVVGGLFNPGLAVAVFGLVLATFCTLQLFNPALRRVEEGSQNESLLREAVTG